MADEFLSTRWSLVLSAAGDDSAAGRALETLCRESWRPLYAYARRAGCGPEDAEDAVQGFLASLLARKSLRGAAPERGRFRSFLLSGIRNHMSDVHSRATARKRGGGAAHVSLEAAESGYAALAAQTESPERAFDRVWAMAVLERARAALEKECADSGKAAVFAALFPADGGSAPAYAELSALLGITENTLRTTALRLRRRWGELVRAELAQTVSTRSDLEQELESLRAALAT